MNTKDWKLKPVQENYDLQDVEDDDDDEEALSLCDLASDDYWGDEFSKEDQSNCFDDQEMFEFFSVKEDFSASASPKNDNIIFCGKLIPYKGEKEDELQEQSYQKNISDQPKEKDTEKISSKFSWKSFSLNRSRSTASLKIQQEKSYRTCKTFPESSSKNKNNNSNCDFPMKKVSLLSSPSKSRWYLFAFGVGRYPMESKLSDIKTRQSKLSDSKMRQSIKNPASFFRSNDRRELADQRSGKREKGWWGLFRNFGCRSSHANAIVKAPLGCIA